MRKKAEVQKAEQWCFELLWYLRHKTLDMPENTPPEIIAKAEEVAKKIEEKADPEYLASLLRFDYEYGMLCGRLVALRWMLGMEWDQEGILDT
jgi:hypothetical protein